MFGFFMGLIVGFLGMWLLRGKSSTSGLQQGTRELGSSAQHAVHRASTEARVATEQQRSMP